MSNISKRIEGAAEELVGKIKGVVNPAPHDETPRHGVSGLFGRAHYLRLRCPMRMDCACRMRVLRSGWRTQMRQLLPVTFHARGGVNRHNSRLP